MVLDDDAPGTNYGDNSGRVPNEMLSEIDKSVDDGDTSTGEMFIGNGTGLFPDGEGAWRVYRVGEDS